MLNQASRTIANDGKGNYINLAMQMVKEYREDQIVNSANKTTSPVKTRSKCRLQDYQTYTNKKE
jgi:hypothetical protein